MLNLRLSRPVVVNLQMPTIHGITITGGGQVEYTGNPSIEQERSGGSELRGQSLAHKTRHKARIDPR